jgi:hypothetical protein
VVRLAGATPTPETSSLPTVALPRHHARSGEDNPRGGARVAAGERTGALAQRCALVGTETRPRDGLVRLPPAELGGAMVGGGRGG